MEYLTKNKRNFNVCSDCVYFQTTGKLDERYPVLKGFCKKYDDKEVNELWETTCKQLVDKKEGICGNCKHAEYSDFDEGIMDCHLRCMQVEENQSACQLFEKD